MNFKQFEIYGKPTLRQGGWTRTGEGNSYIQYAPDDPNYNYRICTLDYVPQHHPNQITVTGIASKELEVSVLALRSDNYIISALGWQDNGYTFNLGSTYDKLGVMFRFKNGDAINPNLVSFDIVGGWSNIPHYIHNTSTDTITTLPAVLYPNDTTAMVGVKGNTVQSGTPTPVNPIMPQGCGNYSNLFNEATAVYDKYIDGNGVEQISSTGENNHSAYIPIKSGLQYTLAETKPNYRGIVSAISWYTSAKVFIQRDSATLPNSPGRTSNTWTAPSNAAYAIINFYRYPNFDGENDMLNEGSTPLPYEPYGQYKIPILSTGQTTPVYLGEVQTTRRIKKKVFDGTENFTKNAPSNPNNFLYYQTGYGGNKTCICTHLEDMGTLSTGKIGIFNANSVLYFNFGADVMTAQTSGNTVAGLKEYLAQQYAAGTPVTVWYVLATEETAVVNEPLMRIGDYADTLSDVSIPVTAGGDTLSVDTTVQPSEVTVNYKGWHPVADVHERDNGAWT